MINMQMIQKIFFNNYLLMLPIIAWTLAQLLKAIIDLILNGKFNLERMFGSGGMPSSHSALVCSLCVGAAKKFGLSSAYFAITFAFAAVVMYDAMGVRLETGKQARLINIILDDLREYGQGLSKDLGQKKLKELVGHTPLQVLSGAILGIIIAVISPVF